MGAGFDGVDGTDQRTGLETEIVMISAWNVVAPLIHQSITTSKAHPLAARSVDPASIRVMASPSAITQDRPGAVTAQRCPALVNATGMQSHEDDAQRSQLTRVAGAGPRS